MPQFVMPRTTPPAVRTWLPAVRAILEEVLGMYGGGGGGCDGSVLFDLVDAAAGTDLGKRVSMVIIEANAPRLTTPINSYNMADMCWWCVCAPAAVALSVMFERLAAS